MKFPTRLAMMTLLAKVADNVPDALLLCGAIALSRGAWMIYPPAGWIVAGVLLLAAGVLASRPKARSD